MGTSEQCPKCMATIRFEDGWIYEEDMNKAVECPVCEETSKVFQWVG